MSGIFVAIKTLKVNNFLLHLNARGLGGEYQHVRV